MGQHSIHFFWQSRQTIAVDIFGILSSVCRDFARIRRHFVRLVAEFLSRDGGGQVAAQKRRTSTYRGSRKHGNREREWFAHADDKCALDRSNVHTTETSNGSARARLAGGASRAPLHVPRTIFPIFAIDARIGTGRRLP